MAYKALAQIARKGSIMFLKIGNEYINLDNVTIIVAVDDTVLKVYQNVSSTDSYGQIAPDYTLYCNEEAKALRSYLDSMAVDVLAVYAEKNKPDCETCNDTGAIAIRGDDDVPCPDCKREGL